MRRPLLILGAAAVLVALSGMVWMSALIGVDHKGRHGSLHLVAPAVVERGGGGGRVERDTRAQSGPQRATTPGAAATAAVAATTAALRGADGGGATTEGGGAAGAAGSSHNATATPLATPMRTPWRSSPRPTTNGDPECNKVYGTGLLDAWNATFESFCFGEEEDGSFGCASFEIPGTPPVTRPHAYCSGIDVRLNLAKFKAADAPKHRSGYFLGGRHEHYRYSSGAFSARGHRSSAFDINKLPKDHLRDIGDGLECVDAWINDDNQHEQIPHTLLFVTREGGEHNNLFHTMTDFLNAYSMMRIFELDRRHLQVVFLDEHPPGIFDEVWRRVFAPAHPILRIGELKAAQKLQLVAGRAVFSPPGYTNILYSKLHGKTLCPRPVDVVMDFAAFFRSVYDVTRTVPSLPVRVTAVSRKPYAKAEVEHKFMARQIPNQDSLLSFLDKYQGKVVYEWVDFAHLTFGEQVQLIANTDVLLGMHGAALSHSIFLSRSAALVELHPKSNDWFCFEHMAQWAGVEYRAWRNRDPRAESKDSSGSYIRVHEAELETIMDGLLKPMLAR